MATIYFSLSPVSPEFTGGAKVYRANVQTNGTVGREELAEAIAAKTKQDKSLALYFLNALNEELAKQIVAGYRVNIGQLATNFSIRGSFMSIDDRFDKNRHTLLPTIHTTEPLKSALSEVAVENIIVGLSCSVYSLMDNVTKELNCITGTHVVHIQGVNLGIDPQNLDEGVRLLDEDGAVKAVATVTESDTQTISCSFATPPAEGVYTLEVSARNGNRTSLAPAVAKLKNIVVKAA